MLCVGCLDFFLKQKFVGLKVVWSDLFSSSHATDTDSMGLPDKVTGALMIVTSVVIFIYYTIWALITVRWDVPFFKCHANNFV